MKVREALRFGADFLAELQVNFDFEAAVLLQHSLAVTKVRMLASLEDELGECDLAKFKGFLEKRRKGEPLAYIIGSAEFCGLDFFVNQDVLIPRMDSEVLVEVVSSYISRNFADGYRLKIVDICTGSGALIVAVMWLLRRRYPEIYGVGVDVSAEALAVAKRNRAVLLPDSRLYFREEDVFSENFIIEGDVVISNPPYIKAGDIGNLEVQVRDYEPRLALNGGDDGLRFYRRLAEVCGGIADIFLEIGFEQARDVREIFTKSGYVFCDEFADSGGVSRVLHFKTA